MMDTRDNHDLLDSIDTDRLRLGQLLRRGLSVLARNAGWLALFLGVCIVPGTIWYFVAGDRLEAGGALVVLAAPVLGWVAASLYHGFSVSIAARRLAGGDVSFFSTMREGLRGLLSLIGVRIVVGLIMIAVSIGVSIPVMLLTWSIGSMGSMGLMIVFGLVALVGFVAVFGLVAAKYFVAIPVAVLERGGVGQALRRSETLTVGNRGPLFWALALTYGLEIGGAWALTSSGVMPFGWISSHWALWTLLSALVAPLLMEPVRAVLGTVAYTKLRRSVDGIEGHELAEVFA